MSTSRSSRLLNFTVCCRNLRILKFVQWYDIFCYLYHRIDKKNSIIYLFSWTLLVVFFLIPIGSHPLRLRIYNHQHKFPWVSDIGNFLEIFAVMQKSIVLFYIEVNFEWQIVNALEMGIARRQVFPTGATSCRFFTLNFFRYLFRTSNCYHILKEFRQFYFVVWSYTYIL